MTVDKVIFTMSLGNFNLLEVAIIPERSVVKLVT